VGSSTVAVFVREKPKPVWPHSSYFSHPTAHLVGGLWELQSTPTHVCQGLLLMVFLFLISRSNWTAWYRGQEGSPFSRRQELLYVLGSREESWILGLQILGTEAFVLDCSMQ
jgi:hypothetical protein